MVNELHLCELFARAFILGGSPCSGKSTIAEMLSERYKLPYYKVDDHDGVHFQRCQPEKQPIMFKYSKMGWDEIWSQPVSVLLDDEFEYYRERVDFILEDLQEFGPDQPVILEGAAMLPELIQRYPVNRKNVIYMLPEKEFQLHHYSQRLWIGSILKACRNPEQAFEHWMERDIQFAQKVKRQANALGFSVMIVDGSISIKKEFEQISAQFGLGCLN
jgi:2-phosphoglycerate kinase